MTRFQILKDDISIDPDGILRNILGRLERLEERMDNHFNSMPDLSFKKSAALLSEQLNQIVQPHREQNPLSVDRLTIPEDMKPYV